MRSDRYTSGLSGFEQPCFLAGHLLFGLPASSRFIAKAEIAKWPIFGLIAQQIGTLFINRSSKRAILRINDDIRGALCNCEAVTIFAEGTTTFGNELLPIKANFIAPVCEIGATVQPVILSYKNKGKPTKQAAFSGDVTLFGSLWNVVTMEDAEVVVHFLEPITNTKRSHAPRSRKDL